MFNARYWMLGAGALGQPRGMVWGGRREEGSGRGTHVYLWQIHFDIWQNQYNIVKFKNKIKLKKRKYQFNTKVNIHREILEQKREIKGIQIGKEEVKLFADNMIQLNIKIQLETGKATSTGIFPLKIYRWPTHT